MTHPLDPALISLPGSIPEDTLARQSASVETFPVVLLRGPFDGLVVDSAPDRLLAFGSSVEDLRWIHVYERTGFSQKGPPRILIYQHASVHKLGAPT